MSGWATSLLSVDRIRGQRYEKWLEQRLVLNFNDTDFVNNVRKMFGYDKTNIVGRGQLTKDMVRKEVCSRSPEDQRLIAPRLSCSAQNGGTTNHVKAPEVNGQLGSTPQQSAYLQGKQSTDLQTALVQGGRRKMRGGSATVHPLPYGHITQSHTTSSPQATNVAITQHTNQQVENAKYDHVKLAKTGGSKTHRRKRIKDRRRKKTRKY